MKRYQTLFLEDIYVDDRVKMRANVSPKVVAEYAEALNEGEIFPPLVVYCDNQKYWLADGFQRYEAYRRAKPREIPCEVRPGGFREALLCACGANACHGLRRTNSDKRKAVMTVLQDEEWSKWSDREIACVCGVSHSFVSNLRGEIRGNDGQIASPTRTVVRGNSEYQMDMYGIQARREYVPIRVPEVPTCPLVPAVPGLSTAYHEAKSDVSPAGVEVMANREPGNFVDNDRPMRDGKGRKLPDRLRPSFTTARQIRRSCRLLARVRAILGTAATLPGGEHLSENMLTRLDGLCEELRGATPYIICPAYHEIAHTRCELCGVEGRNARGYIPRSGYADTVSRYQARLDSPRTHWSRY